MTLTSVAQLFGSNLKPRYWPLTGIRTHDLSVGGLMLKPHWPGLIIILKLEKIAMMKNEVHRTIDNIKCW